MGRVKIMGWENNRSALQCTLPPKPSSFSSFQEESYSIPCIPLTFQLWVYLLYLSLHQHHLLLFGPWQSGCPPLSQLLSLFCLRALSLSCLPFPLWLAPSSFPLSQHAPVGRWRQGPRLNLPPPAGALQLSLAGWQAPWHTSSRHTHTPPAHTQIFSFSFSACLLSLSGVFSLCCRCSFSSIYFSLNPFVLLSQSKFRGVLCVSVISCYKRQKEINPYCKKKLDVFITLTDCFCFCHQPHFHWNTGKATAAILCVCTLHAHVSRS